MGVGGWLGGWVDYWRINLSQLPTKLKLKLKLSLAIKNKEHGDWFDSVLIIRKERDWNYKKLRTFEPPPIYPFFIQKRVQLKISEHFNNPRFLLLDSATVLMFMKGCPYLIISLFVLHFLHLISCLSRLKVPHPRGDLVTTVCKSS